MLLAQVQAHCSSWMKGMRHLHWRADDRRDKKRGDGAVVQPGRARLPNPQTAKHQPCRHPRAGGALGRQPRAGSQTQSQQPSLPSGAHRRPGEPLSRRVPRPGRQPGATCGHALQGAVVKLASAPSRPSCLSGSLGSGWQESWSPGWKGITTS